MRNLLAAFVLIIASISITGFAAAPAKAQITVSISLFHQDLAPHGRWFQHPRWGWAWFPTATDPTWRPYSRGRWVWTEEHGWYWASDEAFGWAVYHYGRWAYDEVYGWVWIPGETWGPAWVAFRYGDSDIGWAPLPPETLDASYGWDPRYTELSASYYQPRWVFIPRRYFLAPRIYLYAAPPARNVIFIRQTVNVTNYITVNRMVVNRSIEPRRIESATGLRVMPARINLVDDHRRVGTRQPGANAINVFRASVQRAPDAAPPETARVKPQDKPRFAIRKDAIAPSERRDAGPTTTPRTNIPPKPTTPPTTTVPPRITTPPTTAIPPKTTTPPTTALPPRTAPPSTTPRVTTIPPKTTKPPTTAIPPRTAPPSTTPRVTTIPPKPRATTPPTPRTITPPPRTTPPALTAPPSPAPAKVQPQPPKKPPSPPPCGGVGQPACPPR